MKTPRIVLALVVTLAAALASEPAFAQGPRGPRGPRVSIGIGFGFGAPFAAFPYYYPPYSYYPYYYPAYYPAPVVVQQQPAVYVEQAAPQVQQQPAAAGYWYYCADAHAYYPYVKECPAGWQRVAPQPGN